MKESERKPWKKGQFIDWLPSSWLLNDYKMQDNCKLLELQDLEHLFLLYTYLTLSLVQPDYLLFYTVQSKCFFKEKQKAFLPYKCSSCLFTGLWCINKSTQPQYWSKERLRLWSVTGCTVWKIWHGAPFSQHHPNITLLERILATAPVTFTPEIVLQLTGYIQFCGLSLWTTLIFRFKQCGEV